MKEYNIGQLLRKIYILRKETNNTNAPNQLQILSELFENLTNQLDKLLYSKYIFKNERRGIIHEAFYELLKSFDNCINKAENEEEAKKIVWEECLPENEENDKRLFSYLLRIIISVSCNEDKELKKEEYLNLRSAVNKQCSKLIKEGTIFQLHPKTFQIKPDIEVPEILNEMPDFDHFQIFNDSAQIGHEKLKELILIILKKLENNRISSSILVEIISKTTFIGNYQEETISSTGQYNEDEKTTIDVSDSNAANRPEALYYYNNVTDEWFATLDYTLKPGKRDLYYLIFYFKYKLEFTDESISQLLDNRIQKSSVNNYYKELISIIKRRQDFEEPDSMVLRTFENFCEKIKLRYSGIISSILDGVENV